MKVAILAAVWVPFAQTIPNHDLLTVWGPLGIICGWLMWRDERRDRLMREIASKNVDAMEKVAHKLNGLSRALVFSAATHAQNGDLKELAERELADMERRAQQQSQNQGG